MKTIQTDGITYFEALEGNGGWYWGSDYASGDLYEAAELFHDHHPIQSNRLLLIHYPEGRVIEPIKARPGQYFGRPAFFDGTIYLLMVDFPLEKIHIFRYEAPVQQVSSVAELPLSDLPDCYNLLLFSAPFMLTRQGGDGLFQIIWPEKAEFPIEAREGFDFRDGDRLYFSRWQEDPDYREEVVVRRYPTGEILEILPGSLWELPDGQRWLLR